VALIGKRNRSNKVIDHQKLGTKNSSHLFQLRTEGNRLCKNFRRSPLFTFYSKEEFGENDRSSTGYLPKEAFETMATRFFNNPTTSVEGWERAVDAQSRIVEAVNKVMDDPSAQGDIAIVSHGGVGTLLLCYLSGSAINRSMDQPGGGGGNVFCFEKESRTLIYNWKSIEES
jgi:broad specificity phosphatase PhoE